MQILNSIWSLLLTENEMVTKIIVAPTTFIEIWLGFLLFTSILKIDYTKNQQVICIILLSISSLINEFIIPAPYNVFINYLIMFIIVKTLLKINIIKSILCTIMPTAIFVLCTVLILNPFLNIFNIPSKIMNNVPIYRIIYLFTFYVFIFFILIIIKHKNIKLDLLINFNTINKRIIIINLFFGLLILCIQNILIAYYINIAPIIITLLNFFTLFVYFFINIYSLNKTMKLQVTTSELETSENYNNTLSYLYDNVKAFKHDFDNMVFILGGYIESGDIDKLKKYYKDLEKDCERVNNLALLNPNLINNSGIYNLLMSKYKEAKDCNVEFKLEYFFDFERLNMPIYEFSRILGILLDNAIEAAKDTDNKEVYVMFRDSSTNNTQLITIKNSYSNKEIDTKKIFEKGISSKENHTGMGLWEVNQIIKRTNNVKLITTKDDNYFTQSLEIYY